LSAFLPADSETRFGLSHSVKRDLRHAVTAGVQLLDYVKTQHNLTGSIVPQDNTPDLTYPFYIQNSRSQRARGPVVSDYADIKM
jgi:hypothetical protein